MGARSVLPERARARSGTTANFPVNEAATCTKELLLEGGREGTWAVNLRKKGYKYEMTSGFRMRTFAFDHTGSHEMDSYPSKGSCAL